MRNSTLILDVRVWFACLEGIPIQVGNYNRDIQPPKRRKLPVPMARGEEDSCIFNDLARSVCTAWQFVVTPAIGGRGGHRVRGRWTRGRVRGRHFAFAGSCQMSLLLAAIAYSVNFVAGLWWMG